MTPAWAPGTAEWISYQNTGLGGIVAPNALSRTIADATAVFSRSFKIGGPGEFKFWGLADDTATVVLSGPGGYSKEFFTAFAQQIDPCAGGGQGNRLVALRPTWASSAPADSRPASTR